MLNWQNSSDNSASEANSHSFRSGILHLLWKNENHCRTERIPTMDPVLCTWSQFASTEWFPENLFYFYLPIRVSVSKVIWPPAPQQNMKVVPSNTSDAASMQLMTVLTDGLVTRFSHDIKFTYESQQLLYWELAAPDSRTQAGFFKG